MQRANIMVALAGDVGNTVPRFSVTAAEIAVLQAIHGRDAVFDIEPVEDIDVKPRDELHRLQEHYRGATDGQLKRIVDVIYPGVGARVFEKLSDLDIDPTFYKATARAEGAKPKKAIKGPVSPGGNADEDGISDLMT